MEQENMEENLEENQNNKDTNASKLFDKRLH